MHFLSRDFYEILNGFHNFIVFTEIRKSFVHDLGHCINIFTNIELTSKLENIHKLHDSFTFYPLKVVQDSTFFECIKFPYLFY